MQPTYPLPEPKLVWTRFFQLAAVPRPSKAEKPAIDWLNRWADDLGFVSRRDATGNLVVQVPATGSGQLEPIILQCHVDIVAVTASGDNGGADASQGKIPTVRGDLDPSHDKRLKSNDAGDWIMAPYSTLGADNGLGVAMMMALAESSDRPRALQLLFTIDEEAGMTGAIGLDPTALGLTGKQLINIDTEDDDEITIGAAGGRDAVLHWSGTSEAVGNDTCIVLSLEGLKGGHSGIEINQGRANAIRLLARTLRGIVGATGARLVEFHGGSRRNAIPDTCRATLAVKPDKITQITDCVQSCLTQFHGLYAGRDNPVHFAPQPTSPATQCLTAASSQSLIELLLALPTGICEMTPEIPGLVESSCNLAIIKLDSRAVAEVVLSVRGTTKEALEDVSETIRSAAGLAAAKVTFADGYPGWKPHLDSQLLKIATQEYRRLFKSEPKVHAVHAGLECGLLIEKLPGLSAISIGPTIKGNHAVGERVQISSTAKSFEYLRAILAAL